MRMTNKEIEALQTEDGKCAHCGQSIKIYRYTLNRNLAVFIRAMAESVSTTGKNDVDISTIGLAYSIRSQITKLRLHGLVARVKDERGVQFKRRWLITNKGWKFIHGEAIPKRVSEFNNQVLGHDGGLVTIYSVLGQHPEPDQKQYAETPITPKESKTYSNVRVPQKYTSMEAVFKGKDYNKKLVNGRQYNIKIKRLEMGKPVEVVSIDDGPVERHYEDIALFQKDWRVL